MNIRRSIAGITLALATVGGCAQPGRPTVRTAAPQADLSTAESAKLCLRMAQSFEAQGYDAEAIAQYERALAFDPKLAATASRRLGVLYAKRDDPARATAAYETAVKVAPDDAALMTDVGYFRLEQSDPGGAERWLRRALAVDPTSSRAWINLGLTLASENRYDESYDAFAHALPPAAARSNVGVEMARQGHLPEAAAALAAALALDPSLPQARAALEWVNAQLHAATQPATRP